MWPDSTPKRDTRRRAHLGIAAVGALPGAIPDDSRLPVAPGRAFLPAEAVEWRQCRDAPRDVLRDEHSVAMAKRMTFDVTAKPPANGTQFARNRA